MSVSVLFSCLLSGRSETARRFSSGSIRRPARADNCFVISGSDQHPIQHHPRKPASVSSPRQPGPPHVPRNRRATATHGQGENGMFHTAKIVTNSVRTRKNGIFPPPCGTSGPPDTNGLHLRVQAVSCNKHAKAPSATQNERRTPKRSVRVSGASVRTVSSRVSVR